LQSGWEALSGALPELAAALGPRAGSGAGGVFPSGQAMPDSSCVCKTLPDLGPGGAPAPLTGTSPCVRGAPAAFGGRTRQRGLVVVLL